MIPDAAVEAVARAIFGPRVREWTVMEELACMSQAKRALEAAAPYLEAQAMEDAVRAFPLETITAPDNAVVWMMRRAEELRSRA